MPTLQDEMMADAQGPSEDKLDRVRKMAEKARDLELTIADLELNLREHKSEYYQLKHETLPRLFNDTGIQRLDLAASGNMPACIATLRDHYKANIQAEWEDEKREKAFALLEEKGLGDLIKYVIEVRFGMDQYKLVQKVLAALRKLKVEAVVQRTVPWNSLTAAIKEIYQQGDQMGDDELSTLGAVVGQMVDIKPKKEK